MTESAATGRHVVENALALYCSAMDTGDAIAAARLLADAYLFFKDQPPRQGYDSILSFYLSVFAAGTGRTAHLFTNVRVDTDETTVIYSCLYQRAHLNGSAPPDLLAIGRYSGRFARDSDGARWLEHRVMAL